MKVKTAFLVAAIFGISLISGVDCRHNPIDSDGDIEPGRRDYNWKVDTLDAGPGNIFYLFSLWGSGPTDVWAVGSGGSSDLCLWHYDGTSWKQDMSRLSSNLMSVYGFGQNDVWASSSPGGIYHFNGQQWSLSYANSISGTHPGLDNIWGDAPNNVYGVGAIDTIGGGYSGEIMHFDGSIWAPVSISKLRVSFNWIRRDKGDGNYYLTGTRFETVGDTNKIFQFDGRNLVQIYSGQTLATVNEVAGKVYECIGKKIYKYQNNQLQLWKDFTGTIYVGRMWGRSEKDFFSVANGGLAHYNGTDIQLLYPTDMLISDVAVFDSDVFVLAWNTSNDITIVAHGVLNN